MHRAAQTVRHLGGAKKLKPGALPLGKLKIAAQGRQQEKIGLPFPQQRKRITIGFCIDQGQPIGAG